MIKIIKFGNTTLSLYKQKHNHTIRDAERFKTIMFAFNKFYFQLSSATIQRFKHTWTLPQGYATPITVYNCVTRRREPLIVRDKDAVTWYTCGPTVYDSSHLGHASCYVKLDIIQRILSQRFGLRLVTCMNITDIDDKIIKKAQELKVDFPVVSRQYEKEFWDDLFRLNIPKPDLVLRVTEHIPLILDFIRKLVDDKVAYVATDNSVYFDVTKSPHPVGKLQNIPDTPPDSSNPHKKSKADFALWKGVKSEEEPFFDSPWGRGRPGWHIECSALASLVFGKNIDIHAGGLDLRFPHHENEEIQSCAFHHTDQWVNYWMHTGHLHLKDSVKMSKSLKNTISIQQLLQHTKPEVFRIACAKSHYSSPMEFSVELLEPSENCLKSYTNLIGSIAEIKKGIIKPTLNNDVLKVLLSKSVTEIDVALCDDFNTPKVFKTLDSIVSSVNQMIHSSATSSNNTPTELYYVLALGNLMEDVLNLFGVSLKTSATQNQDDATEFIELLVKFRQDVRIISLNQKNQDLLTLCDDLRDNLRKCGLTLKDRGKVSSWSR